MRAPGKGPGGPETAGTAGESMALRFLYRTPVGRLLLRPLCCRGVSRAVGAFLSSPLSRPLIGPFVKKNRIELRDYESDHFRCFNDCFSRRIRAGYRPIAAEPEALVAPCDGLLSAYEIRSGMVINVKQSRYTLADLLQDQSLAREFEGGLCLVFRLCVDNYHRYCYVDDGRKGKNIFISGRLHTVRPIALRTVPVFCENCREYTVIESEQFGRLVQMEVGAMLVGRICNYHGAGPVKRGQEKGMFLYGGSTVIVLVKAGSAAVDRRLLGDTARGLERPVKMGQKIGERVCSGK